MHVKTSDGQVVQYPYGTSRLLTENPNVSFPIPIPESLLAEYGIFTVTPTPQPSVDDRTHFVREASPAFEDGRWVQKWDVVPHDHDFACDLARHRRNELLSQSDWTQVADAPVDKQAWATYRQALRDITAQAGFPFAVEWPEQPQ